MEQAKERLHAHLKLLDQAADTLAEALRQPLTEFIRDAAIQRFEYLFELSWKTMRVAAAYMGTVCQSPREAIKTAFKLGWTTNVDGWLEAMEARNETSHTYNEKIAQQVYEVAKKFPALVQELLGALRGISV